MHSQGPVSRDHRYVTTATWAARAASLLVGGAAALARGADPAGWWGQAGVVEQAAGNHSGDAELAGQLREAGLLLAARGEVAGKVGEALGARSSGHQLSRRASTAGRPCTWA